MKNVSFQYFRPLLPVYSRSFAAPGADLELYENDESMFYVVALWFLFCFMIKLGRGSAQTYYKFPILKVVIAAKRSLLKMCHLKDG